MIVNSLGGEMKADHICPKVSLDIKGTYEKSCSETLPAHLGSVLGSCCKTSGVYHQLSTRLELQHDKLSGNQEL